ACTRQSEPGVADGGGVAAEVRAVARQRLELARDLGRLAGQVALVAVLGDQPQRALLAVAADQDRGAAGPQRERYVQRLAGPVVASLEARALAAEHGADDLQRLLQPVEALAQRREPEAVAGVLGLEPAGADAEHRAAARDHVERGRDLREQRRGPVGVSWGASGEG